MDDWKRAVAEETSRKEEQGAGSLGVGSPPQAREKGEGRGEGRGAEGRKVEGKGTGAERPVDRSPSSGVRGKGRKDLAASKGSDKVLPGKGPSNNRGPAKAKEVKDLGNGHVPHVTTVLGDSNEESKAPPFKVGKLELTGDSSRDKLRELLVQYLCLVAEEVDGFVADKAHAADVAGVATEVEQALWDKHGGGRDLKVSGVGPLQEGDLLTIVNPPSSMSKGYAGRNPPRDRTSAN